MFNFEYWNLFRQACHCPASPLDLPSTWSSLVAWDSQLSSWGLLLSTLWRSASPRLWRVRHRRLLSSFLESYWVSKNFILLAQGGMEHWTVYYTSPQSFMITFSYSHLILGTYIEFWLLGLLNWVYKRLKHWFLSTEGVIWCIINGDVHRPLSYPFRSCFLLQFDNENI